MFEKIKLTYDTLKPYIDDETLFLHYNKHYEKYLNNLNKLLIENNYNYNSLYDLIENISKINLNDRGEILYNLGGVLNHSLYFYNMSNLNNNIPVKELNDEINKTFGSYEIFKKEFKKSALNLKGSGYTFLVLDDNKLKIINTSNQDTPYYYGYVPILALDLWEHSYYLKYKNKKESYIDAWFNLIDFEKTNDLYLKLKK